MADRPRNYYGQMSVDRAAADAAEETPGLVRTLRILRERWMIIVGTTIVAAVVAGAYSSTRPKEYTATSKLLFRTNTLAQQVGGVAQQPDNDPAATKATNILLVTTSSVGQKVAAQLKLSPDIGNEVTADGESDANVVDIHAVDADPVLAAKIANTWAQAFVAYSLGQAVQQAKDAETTIQAKLAALGPNDPQRPGLTDALTKLGLAEAAATSDASFLQAAAVPTSPSAPKPKRDAVIAGALGLLARDRARVPAQRLRPAPQDDRGVRGDLRLPRPDHVAPARARRRPRSATARPRSSRSASCATASRSSRSPRTSAW